MYFTQQCVWHFFPPSSLGQDPTLVGVLSQAEASRRINVSADIPTSERALAQSYLTMYKDYVCGQIHLTFGQLKTDDLMVLTWNPFPSIFLFKLSEY